MHWNPTSGGGGFWALTRYRDVAAAYNDHGNLSSARGAMLGGSLRSEVDTASGRMLVASDLPRHRLLRQTLHRAFAPTVMSRMRTQVGILVDRAVNDMLAQGGCDFAADIALELPRGALMAIMDIDREQAGHLIALTRRMIGYRDPHFGADPAESVDDQRLRLGAIQAEIFGFFLDLIEERRDSAGTDLIGMLLTAEVNGRPFSEEDLIYNCMNVAVGGNETSSYTACSGMLELARNPRHLALLAGRPQLTDSAVDEMVRWASVNAYVQRVALRELEIGGKTIRAGDIVTLWNASANYDEDFFPDARVFDVTRSPNRHLSYGFGLHRCIGAAFAQVELGVMLERLVATGLRFEVAGPVRRLWSNFILGITALPIAVSGEAVRTGA
ncbi:cytochrome P450 [Micromonospora sp. NPDC053740]|uniref:cytochrome P450 n=1 Tax=Micromonospora sp. NPDC053740 TaxID=3155173 RepID=UPI003421BBF0